MTKPVSRMTAPLALAAALVAGQAWAGPPPVDVPTVTGIVGVDYARLSPSTGSGADQWGLGGGVHLNLSPSFDLEGSAGYHKISSGGTDLNTWDLQAVGVIKAADWKLGPVLSYEKTSVSGFDTEVRSWGGFADYQSMPVGKAYGWRVHAQAGGFDTNFGVDGSYVGAGLKLYPCPKFAAGLDVNYTKFNGASFHETDYSVNGEYLLGDSPFAIKAGYTRADFSNSGGLHFNTYSLGLSYYFNGSGKSSLQERHDTGLLPYNAGLSSLALKF